jgi:hypothetical protein
LVAATTQLIGVAGTTQSIGLTIGLEPHVRAVTEVVLTLAATGRTDHARRLILAVNKPTLQVEMLTEVGKALVEAGQPGRIEPLVNIIADPCRRVRVLIEVVRALEVGQQVAITLKLLADAERFTGQISDPDKRTAMQAVIAAMLLERGSTSGRTRAHAIVSSLLTGRFWFRAMPIVAALEPAVATATGVAVANILAKSGSNAM